MNNAMWTNYFRSFHVERSFVLELTFCFQRLFLNFLNISGIDSNKSISPKSQYNEQHVRVQRYSSTSTLDLGSDNIYLQQYSKEGLDLIVKKYNLYPLFNADQLCSSKSDDSDNESSLPNARDEEAHIEEAFDTNIIENFLNVFGNNESFSRQPQPDAALNLRSLYTDHLEQFLTMESTLNTQNNNMQNQNLHTPFETVRNICGIPARKSGIISFTIQISSLTLSFIVVIGLFLHIGGLSKAFTEKHLTNVFVAENRTQREIDMTTQSTTATTGEIDTSSEITAVLNSTIEEQVTIVL